MIQLNFLRSAWRISGFCGVCGKSGLLISLHYHWSRSHGLWSLIPGAVISDPIPLLLCRKTGSLTSLQYHWSRSRGLWSLIPGAVIPDPIPFFAVDPWSHVSLQPCNRYTTQGLPEVSLPLEIRGVAWDFEDVRTEFKVGPLKVLQTREVRCGHASAENFSNFRSQKCHFLRFPQEIFSK